MTRLFRGALTLTIICAALALSVATSIDIDQRSAELATSQASTRCVFADGGRRCPLRLSVLGEGDIPFAIKGRPHSRELNFAFSVERGGLERLDGGTEWVTGCRPGRVGEVTMSWPADDGGVGSVTTEGGRFGVYAARYDLPALDCSNSERCEGDLILELERAEGNECNEIDVAATYTITTTDPQIQEERFDLNSRFSIAFVDGGTP